MRQPKFNMGAKVTAPLTVSNQDTGFTRVLRVDAIVSGVSYDPKNGTYGAPFYYYKVLPVNGHSEMLADEKQIELISEVE